MKRKLKDFAVWAGAGMAVCVAYAVLAALLLEAIDAELNLRSAATREAKALVYQVSAQAFRNGGE